MSVARVTRRSLQLHTSFHTLSIRRNTLLPLPIFQKRHLRVAPLPASNMSALAKNKLTYYTFGTPNGLKPAIVLEELGLKYDPVTVNIGTGAQKEPWYLEINPNGRIPALKDGDLRVFESGAVMLYLTDNYDTENKISFASGTEDYYEMLSWLMWQMGGLGPMQGKSFSTQTQGNLVILTILRSGKPFPTDGGRILKLRHQEIRRRNQETYQRS
jgi:Glutathione S-transferase, N-terminal domain